MKDITPELEQDVRTFWKVRARVEKGVVSLREMSADETAAFMRMAFRWCDIAHDLAEREYQRGQEAMDATADPMRAMK